VKTTFKLATRWFEWVEPLQRQAHLSGENRDLLKPGTDNFHDWCLGGVENTVGKNGIDCRFRCLLELVVLCEGQPLYDTSD
jgi:hypothetical protein